MAQRNVIVFNCQGILDSSTRRPAVCKDSLHTATDGENTRQSCITLKSAEEYRLKEHAFSTVAFFATVQSEGGGQVRRVVEYSRIVGV